MKLIPLLDIRESDIETEMEKLMGSNAIFFLFFVKVRLPKLKIEASINNYLYRFSQITTKPVIQMLLLHYTISSFRYSILGLEVRIFLLLMYQLKLGLPHRKMYTTGA